MFTIAVLFTALVAVNLAVAWLWIVKRIDERGYGASSRKDRMARMMPVSDKTVVVETTPSGRDTIRVIEPQAGATAGGTA